MFEIFTPDVRLWIVIAVIVSRTIACDTFEQLLLFRPTAKNSIRLLVSILWLEYFRTWPPKWWSSAACKWKIKFKKDSTNISKCLQPPVFFIVLIFINVRWPRNQNMSITLLEGSGHASFMNPFECGKSFPDKLFTKKCNQNPNQTLNTGWFFLTGPPDFQYQNEKQVAANQD